MAVELGGHLQIALHELELSIKEEKQAKLAKQSVEKELKKVRVKVTKAEELYLRLQQSIVAARAKGASARATPAQAPSNHAIS